MFFFNLNLCCSLNEHNMNHLLCLLAVTCSALPEPSNGFRLSCTGTTLEYFNTVCSFFCSPGFDPIGSASRKCLENGTWSGQDFFCQGAKVLFIIRSPAKDHTSQLSIFCKMNIFGILEVTSVYFSFRLI